MLHLFGDVEDLQPRFGLLKPPCVGNSCWKNSLVIGSEIVVLSPSSPLPLGTRVFIFIFDDLGFLQNRSALSQPSSLASQQPRSGSCPGRRPRQPARPRSFPRARCRPLQARLPVSSGARGSRRPRGSRRWLGAEATRSPASQADLEPVLSLPGTCSPRSQCRTLRELGTWWGRCFQC